MSANRTMQNILWKAATSSTSVRKRSMIVANGWRRSFSSFSATPGTQQDNNVVVDNYKAANTAQQLHSPEHQSPKILNNPEHSDATILVDKLLAHTRDLMMTTTTDEENRPIARHIVAYSGGVDSSLVLALLERAKIKAMSTTEEEEESVMMVYGVLGRSPAVPQDQVQLARRVAESIGAPLVEVSTTEGNDDTYIANDGQACLACKTHLYSALEAVASHARSSHNNHNNSDRSPKHGGEVRFQLYNGTNADDLKDTTRVGLIAAQNFHVASPLRYTTKENVRRAARHLGLPNWNVAASPCLRSRLALGVEATEQHLHRIELAERFVKQELHHVLQETSNVRVRLLAGNRARLEIDSEMLPEVETLAQTSSHWRSYFVDTLGFESITTRAFRSGSVAKKHDDDENLSSEAAEHTSSTFIERLREAVA